MPYTDYNQVLQDLAHNIREVNGSTASIRFVDMPDLISAFASPRLPAIPYEDESKLKCRLIPYIGNTSEMSDMSYMFSAIGQYVYPNIDLSSFDTSNATNMERMFADSYVSSIDLGSFDTSNVTIMRAMFLSVEWYNHAGQLDLSSFDTSNVTTMYEMFGNAEITKMWVPLSFVATAVTNDNWKPFRYGTASTCHVYTDASSAADQGWGTVDSAFVVHYNSTHTDYENA